MEEEQKEKVSSDEGGEGEKKTNVPSEGEWVEEMGVDVKEDQVLAALGNIGRWQVQIIMITGWIMNLFWIWFELYDQSKKTATCNFSLTNAYICASALLWPIIIW